MIELNIPTLKRNELIDTFNNWIYIISLYPSLLIVISIAIIVVIFLVIYEFKHDKNKNEIKSKNKKETSIVRICPKCNKAIPKDVNFCPYCSHRFIKEDNGKKEYIYSLEILKQRYAKGEITKKQYDSSDFIIIYLLDKNQNRFFTIPIKKAPRNVPIRFTKSKDGNIKGKWMEFDGFKHLKKELR